MLSIVLEGPSLGPAVESLLDRAFGPQRQAKISYRYRQGVAPLAPLCFAAYAQGQLVATLRHWPVALSGETAAGLSAVLLGPIAVDPAAQAGGIGAALMRHGLAEATRLGVDLVLLVGDPAYYARFGFAPAASWGIAMPDEAPHRVQALALTPAGACVTAGGLIMPLPTARPARPHPPLPEHAPAASTPHKAA